MCRPSVKLAIRYSMFIIFVCLKEIEEKISASAALLKAASKLEAWNPRSHAFSLSPASALVLVSESAAAVE